MAPISVKCPKCGNPSTFQDGKVFSFCNKCGCSLERDLNNNVSVYDKDAETDENILFSRDRCDACAEMKIPTRADHDIESLGYEIERMMDEFMTFAEVEKDILSSIDSMPPENGLRVCEQCFAMVDRIFMQFEQFLKEYNDFGMYDELKAVRDSFQKKLQELSSKFSAEQNKAFNSYWADRQDELAELKAKLEDAKTRRTKIYFYEIEKKWELDNEIAELEHQINRVA